MKFSDVLNQIRQIPSKVKGAYDSVFNAPPIILYGKNGPPPNNFSAVKEAVAAPLPVEPTQAPVQTPAPMMRAARNPAFSKFKVPDNVRVAIDKATDEFKLPPSLLYDIALQESSFNPTLKNPLPGSTAGGLFQFTDGTWDTVGNYSRMKGSSLRDWNNPDKFDPEANARAAAYLIKNGQLGRWTASSDVWGPHYTKDELLDFFAQTGTNDIPALFR